MLSTWTVGRSEAALPRAPHEAAARTARVVVASFSAYAARTAGAQARRPFHSSERRVKALWSGSRHRVDRRADPERTLGCEDRRPTHVHRPLCYGESADDGAGA